MNTMKTLGHRVIKFIESYCVPFNRRLFRKTFCAERLAERNPADMFEIREDGSFKYHTAYISTPKRKWKIRNSISFSGCRSDGTKSNSSPNSFSCKFIRPSDIVFSSAKQMIQNGELRHYADLMERKIVLKDNPQAQILRVPCVAGVNDGMRPSMAIFDEVHEMTGNKERALGYF